MAGAHDLVERLSSLARDLGTQSDTVTTLERVVGAAVELVDPCHSAGISLATRRGRITTSAASDPIPNRGDELQMEHGEGPCRDAVWDRHMVVVTDLGAERRWPSWSPHATRELGMQSMLCLRLFTHDDVVGALNLYAREPHAFDRQHMEVAIALSAHAAVAAVAAQKIEHLEQGLVNRATIGQAVGMTMQSYGLDSDTAFRVLARLSSESNRKLAVIAEEMVSRHDADVARQRVGERSSALPAFPDPSAGTSAR